MTTVSGRSRGRGSRRRMCFWWDEVVLFLILGLCDGWRYGHGVGDVGKHGVKLSSGRGMVRNIRRCLTVELYRNSMRNSVITPLYSVSLGGLIGVDTLWRIPSSNPYGTP